MRVHIYAIYGLVRIADEIVDTYRGSDAPILLDELKNETLRTLKTGYSSNPVVHAFAVTAKLYNFDEDVIEAFFESMRMDTEPYVNTAANYSRYIYGSAEVIGLMCLSVFTEGNHEQYKKLADGARALGAAYQKINFLRDLASDNNELDRWYFPDSSYESFTDTEKQRIVDDIENDLASAKQALGQLPKTSKRAVSLSLHYYGRLLDKLRAASAEDIKQQRIRVPGSLKLALYMKARLLP